MSAGHRRMNVLRTLTILWAALLASTAFFSALHFVLPPPEAAAPPQMALVLGVVSAGIAVASFLIPGNTLRAAFKAETLPVTEEVDPTAQADYRAQQPKRRVVRVDDALLTTICARFQQPFILSIALSESISLNGLVLERMGEPMSRCAPFFVAGTLLVAARVPTRRAILAAVARAVGMPVVDAQGR